MRLTAKQVMTGMGAYFVAAVGGYLYLRSAKAPAPTPGCGCGGRHPREQGEGGSEAGEQDGQATFDRLADEVRLGRGAPAAAAAGAQASVGSLAREAPRPAAALQQQALSSHANPQLLCSTTP